VASRGAHFGEESPLVGRLGSGTIFFSSCNLLCSFCQNDDISHGGAGGEVGPETLADMMLSLAGQGCHNINLVTPTHVVPQILEGLLLAASRGLEIPLVYNCGGYESLETLKILDGVVDVYMPDFKFWDNDWARYACGVSDYREHACRALKEMHRQVGDLVLAEDGTALRGLLVRHLVMPGDVAGTEKVMEFIAREISRETYVNIMDQYRPCHDALGDPVLGRRITGAEYARASAAAEAAGLRRLDGRRRLRPV
jgi:putative pyruvate formate lyase activating enzyme